MTRLPAQFGLANAIKLLSFCTMMFFSNYQANAISGSVPGELLITFKATTSPSQIMNLQAELDATVIDSIPELGVYHWRIPDTVISASGTILLGVDEVAAYYEYHPDIRYIEPDIYFELTTHLPSGYAAVQPWNLEKIEAPAAWHIQTETDTLVVSVLDTGIDWTHPDLVNHIWQNLAEDKDNDGQTIQYISGQWVLDPDDLDGDDNDNNGFVDDLIGWDFANDDNNPFDDIGHGTHVGGIISADVNNTNEDHFGVSWNTNLMPLKIFKSNGTSRASAIARAIIYSADNGAEISNNSWGGRRSSQVVFDALDYAGDVGQLIVCAAGNNGFDNDAFGFYPANFPRDFVISVGASDIYDSIAHFSHYGQTTVDLFAPGDTIFSTVPNGLFDTKSGTSMATPHVTAAAALVWAKIRDKFNEEPVATMVKEVLMDNVDLFSHMTAGCVSGGRLNLFKALSQVNSDSLIVTIQKQDISCNGSGDGLVEAVVIGCLSAVCDFEWTETTGGSVMSSVSSFAVASAAELMVEVTRNSTNMKSKTIEVIEPAPLAINIDARDEYCAGEGDGAARLRGVGGTAPYTYYLDGNETRPRLTRLTPGSYGVQIMDFNDCNATDNFSIAAATPLTATCIVTDATCPDTADGEITVFASGGLAPYSYYWPHNGDLIATTDSLAGGTYRVEVTDSNGCVLVKDIVVGDSGIYLGNDTILCFPDSMTLDAGPGFTSYNWSTGETTSSISVSAPGTYWVTANVANGCVASDTINVYGSPPPFNIPDTLYLCNGFDKVVNAAQFDDVAAVINSITSFSWYNASFTLIGTGPVITVSNPGTLFLEIEDICGGLSIDSIKIITADSCVWPGDANYDEVVDNRDVISMGLAYGTTTPPRYFPATNWHPQFAFDADTTFINGVNYKHSDANGDGTVDHNDIDVVNQNYGSIRNDGNPKPLNTSGPLSFVPSFPTIPHVSFGADGIVVTAGDNKIEMEIFLQVLVDGVYTNTGFAFTLGYGDGAMLENPLFVFVGDATQFGEKGINLEGLAEDLPHLEAQDVVLVRTDHFSNHETLTKGRVEVGNWFIDMVESVLPVEDPTVILEMGHPLLVASDPSTGMRMSASVTDDPDTLGVSMSRTTLLLHPDFRFYVTATYANCGDSGTVWALPADTNGNTFYRYHFKTKQGATMIDTVISGADSAFMFPGGMVAGEYFLTMTDTSSGDSATALFKVPGSDPMSATFITHPGWGDSTTVTAEVFGGSCIYSYNWSNGATTPTITAPAPDTLILNVDDGAGCFVSDTLILFGDTTAPTALCRNVTLDVATPLTIDTINYGSFDDCSIETLTMSPTGFSCNDLGVNTLTLTVTDSTGLSDTCTALVTIEDTTPPAALCQDVTLVLGGSGTALLTPNDVDNGSSDFCGIVSLVVSQSAFSCNDEGANVVTLTVSDIAGNQSSCSANVEIVNPVTLIVDAGADTTISSGGSVTIGGSPSAGSGVPPFTYLWVPAAGLSSDTVANPDASPTATTTYILTVTDANGCEGQDSVTVDICERPENNVESNISDTSARIDWDVVANAIRYQIQYRALGTAGVNTSISFTNNKTLVGLMPGTFYQYRLRTQCQGQQLSAFKFGNFTTLILRENEMEGNRMETFPNPVSRKMKVAYHAADAGECHFKMINILGKEVLASTKELVAGANHFEFDLGSLTPGVYFLEAKHGDQKMTRKFVKN